MRQQLQQRGEFYASVATHNHYLEYHPNAFFPILTASSSWSRNHTARPLSKGGRVMVDVKRGILEGHLPVKGNGSGSDGPSETVKEAIRLWDQHQRTGVAVPFRTCRLPPRLFDVAAGHDSDNRTKLVSLKHQQHHMYARVGDSDQSHLWQAWPVLLGFSFTARVWGKLVLSLPKAPAPLPASSPDSAVPHRSPPGSPRRHSVEKMGVQFGGLGGEGACGNVGYIQFHTSAFDQLVLADDKKELIRAVARNAGGTPRLRVDEDDDDGSDDDDDDDIALDVVANKGAASIFLLSGPPGKSCLFYVFRIVSV